MLSSPWSLTALFLAFASLLAILLGVLTSTAADDDSSTPLALGTARDAEAPAAADAADAENPDLHMRGVVDRLPAPEAFVELSRGRLATGAGWDVVVPGPVLYGVEAGALGIRVDGSAMLTRAGSDEAPQEATVGVDFTLRPGDKMLVLPGTPHTLGNDGGAPAAFLSLAVFPASSVVPSWLPEAERPPGIDLQPLATDVISTEVMPQPGPVEIIFAKTTLGPGDEVTLAPDRFRLLVVDSGTLTLRSGAVEDAGRTYQPGEVARLDPSAGGVARNDGDAPLTFLSVELGSSGVEEETEPAKPTASPAD